MKQVSLSVRTLADAFVGLLNEVVTKVVAELVGGKEFLRSFYKVTNGPNKGRRRTELDFAVVEISNPLLKWEKFVLEQGLKQEYFSHYISWLKTYGSCRKDNGAGFLMDFKDCNFDGKLVKPIQNLNLTPIEFLIDIYKNGGHGTTRACVQMASDDDMITNLSPCFRVLDTKIVEGMLHFYCYFRSCNIWGEFPSDIALLAKILEYTAISVGVKAGSLVFVSKGVHLYSEDWSKAYEQIEELS